MPSAPAPRKPLRRRWWFRAGCLAVAVYLVWVGLLWWYQERLIFPGAFHKMPRLNGAPTPTLIGGTPVLIARPAGESRGVALLLHGNDETAAQSAAFSPESPLLLKAGYTVVTPEYPGYGDFAGTPSQAAIIAALLPVVDWAKTQPGGGRLIYVGYSLGGGVACALAAERKPAALVLRSTFTSIGDFAARMAVPGFLLRHTFDNAAYLAGPGNDVPVLISHGVTDQIVPVSHSRRLAEIAKGHATYVEIEGDHFAFKKTADYAAAAAAWLADLDKPH